jgi:hypothetical protein
MSSTQKQQQRPQSPPTHYGAVNVNGGGKGNVVRKSTTMELPEPPEQHHSMMGILLIMIGMYVCLFGHVECAMDDNTNERRFFFFLTFFL